MYSWSVTHLSDNLGLASEWGQSCETEPLICGVCVNVKIELSQKTDIWYQNGVVGEKDTAVFNIHSLGRGGGKP